MSPKRKRMIIDSSNRRPRSGANMRKTHSRLGVRADRAEIHVVHGWLDGFVHGGAEAFFLGARPPVALPLAAFPAEAAALAASSAASALKTYVVR